MGFILSLLSGGFFKSLFGTVTGLFKAWTDAQTVRYQTGVAADTQVITATIAAQVDLNKQAAALALADKGWWVTAWMKPYVFYPFATHAIAIVFDSMPLLGHKIGSWGIPPLPGVYASMEQTIILAVVGLVGLKGVARVFTKG